MRTFCHLKEVQTNVHKKPYFLVINSKTYLQLYTNIFCSFFFFSLSYRLKKNINVEQCMDSFAYQEERKKTLGIVVDIQFSLSLSLPHTLSLPPYPPSPSLSSIIMRKFVLYSWIIIQDYSNTSRLHDYYARFLKIIFNFEIR